MGLKYFAIFALALPLMACEAEGGAEDITDDFDVQFVLPESICADEGSTVTFTVIDGKAPLLTDSFIFEPADQESGGTSYSYPCSIIETSPESFTVKVSFSLSVGQYNIYIRRDGKRKQYGLLNLYRTSDFPLRILFIGNSFTKDAVEHLPGLIAAAGLKNVTLIHMYYGGRTIPEYYNSYYTANDYTCYTMETGSDSWVSSKNLTLQDAVCSSTWDVVTIQEHTGTRYAWIWDDEEENAITGLVGYIMDDQGNNVPKISYIMSQAYHDLDKTVSSSASYKTFTTQEEMYEVITTQAKKVLALSCIDEVIATGTMLQNLRTTSLNIDNNMGLTRDGYHMDYGITRYGAACEVFEMLITPMYGVTLDANSYRYSNSNTNTSEYSTPVTDENQPIALKAARNAIENPFEVTDMSDY